MNMGTPKYLSKVSKDDESHLPNRVKSATAALVELSNQSAAVPGLLRLSATPKQ